MLFFCSCRLKEGEVSQRQTDSSVFGNCRVPAWKEQDVFLETRGTCLIKVNCIRCYGSGQVGSFQNQVRFEALEVGAEEGSGTQETAIPDASRWSPPGQEL